MKKFQIILFVIFTLLFFFISCNEEKLNGNVNNDMQSPIIYAYSEEEAQNCFIYTFGDALDYEIVLATKDNNDKPFAVFSNYAGIRGVNTEFLSDFESTTEFNLRKDGFGDDLVIWAINEPLLGFELLQIDIAFDEHYDFYYVPGNVLLSFDALSPSNALVIRNFVGHGIRPWYAISFLDINGHRRYVAFWHAMAGMYEFVFTEFALTEGTLPFALPDRNLSE